MEPRSCSSPSPPATRRRRSSAQRTSRSCRLSREARSPLARLRARTGSIASSAAGRPAGGPPLGTEFRRIVATSPPGSVMERPSVTATVSGWRPMAAIGTGDPSPLDTKSESSRPVQAAPAAAWIASSAAAGPVRGPERRRASRRSAVRRSDKRARLGDIRISDDGCWSNPPMSSAGPRRNLSASEGKSPLTKAP
jgi:hypothetical protein